jgi:hypothetical protein
MSTNHRRQWVIKTLAMALALCAAQGAEALREGTTAQGGNFVTGGVGSGEREVLEVRKSYFSLSVLTAEKGSGAFLAGADVRIFDDDGRPILDLRLDGPWLLVGLKRGAYTVEMASGGATQRKTTTIHRGDHHEMVFYFEDVASAAPGTASKDP